MWSADIGVGLAVVLLAGWALVVVLTATVGRSAVGSILAGPARLPVLAGTGAATALLAAQAGVVDSIADSAGSGILDHAVLAWFVAHRAPAVTVVMTAVSALGGTATMTVLASVAAVLLWYGQRRAQAAIVLAAALGAGVLVAGFKHLYGRARPPLGDRLALETNFALPSGHAVGSVVVVGVLATVAVLLLRWRAAQAGVVAVAVSGIVVIGVSRLYLGVHWATDVLTGWLLGGAWLAICVTALVLLHPPRPIAAPAGELAREPG